MAVFLIDKVTPLFLDTSSIPHSQSILPRSVLLSPSLLNPTARQVSCTHTQLAVRTQQEKIYMYENKPSLKGRYTFGNYNTVLKTNINLKTYLGTSIRELLIVQNIVGNDSF